MNKIYDFNSFITESIKDTDEKNTISYYVAWSALFNHPSNKYDISLISKAVKDGGATRVRSGYAFGWSNQPKVVIFNANNDNLSAIKNSLEKALNTSHFIITVKDW